MYSNNKFELAGEIITEFEFHHEMYDEKFYKATLRTERNSGVADFIPIVVSEKILNMSYRWLGTFISLCGQYRSYNIHRTEGKNKLDLYMFADSADFVEYMGDINHIELDGYVVKKPYHRKTPKGRYITELIMAVNRSYGKTDYIPVIFWERNAMLATRFEVGTHINIVGRVQSREYFKRFEDGSEETKVAYEVSVQDVWEV